MTAAGAMAAADIRAVNCISLHTGIKSDTIEGNKNASVQPLAPLTERMFSMSSSIVPYDGDSRQPQQFDFNGNPLTANVNDSGEFSFLASDACAILELGNVSQAVSRLDEDEKFIITKVDNGVPVRNLWITESGLYSLIIRSNKPEAKAFKRWVTHEVLPSIRKTGGYAVKPMTPTELSLLHAQILVDIEQKLAQAVTDIEDIKDELQDRNFLSIETWCKTQGIKEGIKSFALRSKWGRECSDLSRQRGVEIKKALDEPHTPGRYHVSILRDVCIPKPRLNGQMPLIGSGK